MSELSPTTRMDPPRRPNQPVWSLSVTVESSGGFGASTGSPSATDRAVPRVVRLAHRLHLPAKRGKRPSRAPPPPLLRLRHAEGMTPFGRIPLTPFVREELVLPRGHAVPGDLLVAGLSLTDSTFGRSVVMVLDHDENGALGVVVTQPTDISVDDILPGWSAVVTGDPVVHQGGPVALDSALALAVCPSGEAVEGFRPVVGAVGLIDLDSEPEVIGRHTRSFRVFAGYAGWGAGQLDDEIREGAWYVFPAEAGDAFDEDPESLWFRVLERHGGDSLLISLIPPDPSQN